MSRNKGARSERALRDELIRLGWSHVTRVPLSGAVKSKVAYQDDVVGVPPGWDHELRFENKARATGFDSIYALVPPGEVLAFSIDAKELYAVSLNVNETIHQNITYADIATFDVKTQKVLRQIAKKCADWIGGAHILSLKQDRRPFIYIRHYR